MDVKRSWRDFGRGSTCLIVAVCALTLAAALPSRAGADWTRVSTTPSTTAPYLACPPRHGMVRCELIVDPAPPWAARGPLRAGAITTGPSAEVRPALSGSGVGGGFSPADLRAAYGLPSETAGSGQTVAVVDAYDDPNAESDLNTYRSEYGIPPCTAGSGCFSKVNQEGITHYPSPNAAWADEISLDLDMVSAVCPNCHLLLVEANDATPANLAEAENEAAALGATEISNSFGSPGMKSPNEAAFEHPGTTTTFSGGDEGYGGNQYASNPHVIAVGGTTLEPAGNSRGWVESVWYHYSTTKKEFTGTGSGCTSEPKPVWQQDPGCPTRTTNDVAAVADQNTPVSDYNTYKTTSPWRLSGGTSVASPIIAGAMALANGYTRSFEAAEPLYVEEAESGAGFFDVLSGNNGFCETYLCEAGVGYDGPSGLGALDGAPEVAEPPTLPPLVADREATLVSPAEAMLNASVSPVGRTVTDCYFEYGSSPELGSTAPCSSSPGSGTNPVPVSATISGLEAGTYYFRIVASNEIGTGASPVHGFTTRPPTHWYSPVGWKMLEGQSEKVTSKGRLTLYLAGSTSITCKVKAGGTIENPAGGAAGVNQFSTFALAGCKASPLLCAKREKLVLAVPGLPWQGELVAGPPVADQLTDVAITITCVKSGSATVFDELTGSLAPTVGEDVLAYSSSSGELEGHGPHPEAVTVSGEQTLTGPKKRTITAKASPTGSP